MNQSAADSHPPEVLTSKADTLVMHMKFIEFYVMPLTERKGSA